MYNTGGRIPPPILTSRFQASNIGRVPTHQVNIIPIRQKPVTATVYSNFRNPLTGE